MRNFLKLPVVITILGILFGVTVWQTGSILAVLGIGTVAVLGWSLMKGAPLSQAITLPVALWAGGFGLYNPIAAGSSVSVSIVNCISYIAGALYLVWLVPTVIRHGFTWDAVIKGVVGLVIVGVVIAGLTSLVS